MTEHVVVDVDPGIDDAYALAVLLGAQKIGILKIAAIVCSAGNTSRRKACFNLVRVLITLNAYDIPVFEGTWHPIMRSQLYSRHFGMDGFGDIFDKPSSPLKLNSTQEFCHFIQTKYKPRKLTMLCFAPLTLTAGLILENSQRFFKEIWIMGGNHPEELKPYWTFQRDPEAVDVVLKHVRAPITIVPWELSHQLCIPMTWRRQELGCIKQPFMMVMNLVESTDMRANTAWRMPNAIMAVAYVFPETIMNSSMQMVVVNRDFPITNQTGLLIPSSNYEKRRLVKVLMGLDSEKYISRLLEVVNQTHDVPFQKESLCEEDKMTEPTDPADEYGWTTL